MRVSVFSWASLAIRGRKPHTQTPAIGDIICIMPKGKQLGGTEGKPEEEVEGAAAG
jgi:hypothetical protein